VQVEAGKTLPLVLARLELGVLNKNKMFGFIWHLPETSFPWQFRSPKDKHVRGQRVVYLILYAKYLQRFM